MDKGDIQEWIPIMEKNGNIQHWIPIMEKYGYPGVDSHVGQRREFEWIPTVDKSRSGFPEGTKGISRSGFP